MNDQVREFLSSFKEVRLLTEERGILWQDASSMGVSRSWFELSRISPEDRIEFTKEFWLTRLALHVSATPAIEQFFSKLDDIALIATRQTTEEPWRIELIYSLGDNSSFFRGLPPASTGHIEAFQATFDVRLPRDYCAFFHLHNGFGKLTETGLLPLEEIKGVSQRLIQRILGAHTPLRFNDALFDPHLLVPFYEEYGIESFQCFNADWYPSSEMGNVHFSSIDWTLSDVTERNAWAEELAYPTFLEWLAAFLHGMNGS